MSDYPMMLYKDGVCDDHNLWGEPLMMGDKPVAFMIVHSPEEEQAATAEGWRYEVEAVDTDKPRRGRPPKEPIAQ